MKPIFDEEKLQYHIRGILEALGENPDREGLKDTPARVARMYQEVFEGIRYTNDEIAQMFNKTFEEDLSLNSQKDVVIVRDIEVFSHCEHHMALMYDMNITVAYVPCGKVIGLSKIVRIADMVARRLQLQERIGSDIAQIISAVTGSSDVAVIIEGYHSCMTARGIKKNHAKTITKTFMGRFETDDSFAMRLIGM